MDKEKVRILNMVREEKITAEEGTELLESLEKPEAAKKGPEEQSSEPANQTGPVSIDNGRRGKWWWIATCIIIFMGLNAFGIFRISSLIKRASYSLRVESFVPQGKTTPETQIMVRFTKDMVEEQDIGKVLSNAPVKFNPSIAGRFQWSGKRELKFLSDEKLKTASIYTAAFIPEISALDGTPLSGKDTFSFQTPPLDLIEIKQGISSDLRPSFTLRFNDQISPGDLQKYLEIRDSRGRRIAYQIQGLSDKKLVRVKLQKKVTGKVTVSLSKGLCGISGPLGLERDFIQKVDIQTEFRVGSISRIFTPSAGNSKIYVNMTKSVLPDEAKKLITIDPDTEFYLKSSGWRLIISGDFQPGRMYKIKFPKGLKAADKSELSDDVVRAVRIPDRQPLIRFKGEGTYLCLSGSLILPVETMNVDEFTVSAERIYRNNVVHLINRLSRYSAPRFMGRSIDYRDIKTNPERNKPVETLIDLKELLDDDLTGMTLITVRDKKRSYKVRRKLVLATDLGISVKESKTGFLVWINSISTLTPVENAKVTVYSKKSQIILEGVTNTEGLCYFKKIPQSKEDNPFLVLVSRDKDLSYLELGKHRLRDTEFDIRGRPYLSKGYEAFVYTDRGIYRPGESVHLMAVVRGQDLGLPASFPVTWDIKRPDGRRFGEFSGNLSNLGTCELTVKLPGYALTGKYKALFKIPGEEKELGNVYFNVEEFIPDRMKAKVAVENRRFKPGEEISYEVIGIHLFGQPAKGRKVSANLTWKPIGFHHHDWEEYQFGDKTKDFRSLKKVLGSSRLDSSGRFVFKIKVPDGLKPPGAVSADFQATVKEVGGRGVTATASAVCDPYPFYVGLNMQKKPESGSEIIFRCAAVSPDGKPLDKGVLSANIYKRVWHTLLKVDKRGYYKYVNEKEDVKIFTKPVRIDSGNGSFSYSPKETGQYMVKVSDEESGSSASFCFYIAGPERHALKVEKPDRVDIGFDKDIYKPGENALISIKAPFDGKALFCLEGDEIVNYRILEIKNGFSQFSLPVETSFSPNMYCSVTLIRKLRGANEWAPHRAFGIAPLCVDCSSRKLSLTLSCPETIRPLTKLNLDIDLKNAAGESIPGEVTIAVVDEGICRLTNFLTPDPWSFFFGKRQIGTLTADIYSYMVPEYGEKKLGKSSEPGGGMDRLRLRQQLCPVTVERVKPVAIWVSGIKVGNDGHAKASLDIPEFTGKLRLMAVAVSTDAVGSCEKGVICRRPFMMRASLPRFLSTGDDFTLPVVLFNHTGDGGTAKVSLEVEGAIRISGNREAETTIADGGEETLFFTLKASDIPGKANVKTLAVFGDEMVEGKVELAVRPPAPVRTLSGSGSVKAGKTQSFILPRGLMEGTDKYILTFSSLPAINLGSSLGFLLHYPYGCIEQTVSSTFPLLYLRHIAKLIEPERFSEEEIDEYVQAGIYRILSMQTFNGSLAMWPGHTKPYPWGSIYGGHLLVEADKAGYYVPAEEKEALLNYLRDILGMRGYDKQTLATKAYACFVLALDGKPDISWIKRLEELKEDMPAYSRFQLAQAVFITGREDDALKLVGGRVPVPDKHIDTGGILHSMTRESSIMLSSMLDIQPDSPSIPVFVERINTAMKNGRWRTTQENAFAIMALGKYARMIADEKRDFTAGAAIAGRRLGKFDDEEGARFVLDEGGGKEVVVSVDGTGTLYYYWVAEGVPVSGKIPETDSGIKVRRRYLNAEGREIDLANIKQGETVVVELCIENHRPVDNLICSDLLPAGLEIENPRIATRERIGWIGKNMLKPERVEMRDDRLIFFANLLRSSGNRKKYYRYVLRAVTRGHFRLPPVKVSCMYDPAIVSVHGAGKVCVVE